jgi:hypothetical protein
LVILSKGQLSRGIGRAHLFFVSPGAATTWCGGAARRAAFGTGLAMETTFPEQDYRDEVNHEPT